ncbi:type II secretion system protein E [Alphaproteobacteria bacterium]|nr:type II secretion system protein E [Alphaproteobacteria bacterium]GHS97657.1 type II secretion system protein E [Alphaproteobacteria bacterium]
MKNFQEKLQNALRDAGLLRLDQVDVVLEEQRRTQEPFDEICIRLGFVESSVVKKTLADITGIPYVDLDENPPNRIIVQLLSRELQEKYSALLFSKTSSRLKIAMADPTHLAAKDALQQQAAHLGPNLCVEFFYADWALIRENLERAFAPSTLAEPAARVFQSEDDISTRLNQILENALDKEASDLHFQPESCLVKVRFRVDGLLQDAYDLHKSSWKNWAIRIKILANIDIAESRRPQAGHFDATFHQKKFDFRVATHPTVHGENIVLRILYKNKKLISLENLGFLPSAQRTLLAMIQKPYGLILLCGPTGSGKTTTLYTLCSRMDADSRNIMTLEEPVEYRFEKIRQTEIQQNGVLTFAEGVRSLLRQDPDVLFIGEIRDEETAQMTLRAAMTGHLVLSTLHSNDALSVPSRLVDLGIPAALLSGQILMIMSQRLVRRLCLVCKGARCPACRETGFKGRLALCEILPVVEDVDLCIALNRPLSELAQCAKKQGYVSMLEDGLEKVQRGLTTLQELERVLGRV